MLFEPYGELVRIDMKRNYAFVQFKTVEELRGPLYERLESWSQFCVDALDEL